MRNVDFAPQAIGLHHWRLTNGRQAALIPLFIEVFWRQKWRANFSMENSKKKHNKKQKKKKREKFEFSNCLMGYTLEGYTTHIRLSIYWGGGKRVYLLVCRVYIVESIGTLLFRMCIGTMYLGYIRLNGGKDIWTVCIK